MKKTLFVVCAVFFAGSLFAQADTTTSPALTVSEPVKKPKKTYNLSNRAKDHFIVQLGYTNWLDAPDSINTKGFSRSINAYFMMDFPFKSSPKLSAAVGIGVGSDHVFLKNNFADVKGKTSTMRFYGVDTAMVDVKKTKVVTTYAELPAELRYTADPENSDKSFKVALGIKVGTMLRGGTRSRITEPNTTPNYLLKESSKNYFNTTRIVGTARIGVGHFTLFASYQFTSLLKAGTGPQLKPLTIGLSLGGL